jgi:hypothetical protein
MARKLKTDAADEPSLLPDIKAEEARLGQALAEATVRAGRIVEDAEREAAETLRVARIETPQRFAETRDRLLAALQAEYAAKRPLPGEIERGVAEEADRNMAAAVAYIVRAVWPTGAA